MFGGGNAMISGKSKVFFNYLEWILALKESYSSPDHSRSALQDWLGCFWILCGHSHFLLCFSVVYCRGGYVDCVAVKSCLVEFYPTSQFHYAEQPVVTSSDLRVDLDQELWGDETVGQISCTSLWSQGDFMGVQPVQPQRSPHLEKPCSWFNAVCDCLEILFLFIHFFQKSYIFFFFFFF